jgi:hypothetical protein
VSGGEENGFAGVHEAQIAFQGEIDIVFPIAAAPEV